MGYSPETFGTAPLEYFSRATHQIYGPRESVRSLWDVLLHAHHHASAIAQQIQVPQVDRRLFLEIADFAMWWFTLVARAEGRTGEPKTGTETPRESLIRVTGPSDLLWNRYPGRCPTCYWRRSVQAASAADSVEPCDCHIHPGQRPGRADRRPTAAILQALASARSADRPATIDDWQRSFQTIFHTAVRELTYEQIILCFLAGLGELSDAMARMYSYRKDEIVPQETEQRRTRLEEELADTLRWLFVIVIKTNVDVARIAEPRYRTLSAIIWERYGSLELSSLFCPFCKQAVCKCELSFVPEDLTVEELLGKTRAETY